MGIQVMQHRNMYVFTTKTSLQLCSGDSICFISMRFFLVLFINHNNFQRLTNPKQWNSHTPNAQTRKDSHIYLEISAVKPDWMIGMLIT